MAKQAATSTATQNSTPSHDEIAAQAYQIYLREGCAEGRDMDHWLRAEAELRERFTSGNANANGNGHAAIGGTERAQDTQAPAPRELKPQAQSSLLPNSVTPPAAPIAQLTRSTTPRRNSGKREPAAAAK
jgi:hypothetical protein